MFKLLSFSLFKTNLLYGFKYSYTFFGKNFFNFVTTILASFLILPPIFFEIKDIFNFIIYYFFVSILVYGLILAIFIALFFIKLFSLRVNRNNIILKVYTNMEREFIIFEALLINAAKFFLAPIFITLAKLVLTDWTYYTGLEIQIFFIYAALFLLVIFIILIYLTSNNTIYFLFKIYLVLKNFNDEVEKCINTFVYTKKDTLGQRQGAHNKKTKTKNMMTKSKIYKKNSQIFNKILIKTKYIFSQCASFLIKLIILKILY